MIDTQHTNSNSAASAAIDVPSPHASRRASSASVVDANNTPDNTIVEVSDSSWITSSMNLLRFGSVNKKNKDKKEEIQITEKRINVEDEPTEKSKSNVLDHCRCCGSVVRYPEMIKKFKCSTCLCIVNLVDLCEDDLVDNEVISYRSVRHKIKECEKAAAVAVVSGEKETKQSPHLIYKPLEQYLTKCFSSFKILNNSFKPKTPHGYHKSHNDADIDFKDLRNTFLVILQLPTKRPFMKMLISINDLLKRPRHLLVQADDLKWLLIIWELPTLPQCLYHSKKKSSSIDTPEVKSLSYEITKRMIGFLSNSDSTSLKHFAGWIACFSLETYKHKVEFLNLYITFHLTRLINANYKTNGTINSKIEAPRSPQYNEFNESSKLNTTRVTNSQSRRSSSVPFLNFPISFNSGFTSWGSRPFTYSDDQETEPISTDFKLKVGHYGNDWHLKTGARLLSVLYVVNKGRLPEYAFYNSLVDYVQVKQDFEIWQSTFRPSSTGQSNKLIIDLIGLTTAKNPQLTMCQYPFLLSLGAKISILEHEARRSMEDKAEEAFIKALDKKQVLDVHFRVKVRRSHISNDSLRCIKENCDDLKKALKVEFIGEPGVDAGGLKKEWFGLLTKELFAQENGMFFYNDESHLCWFANMPLERNDEIYFMVGVVLGLAIYNSTILDLRFPLALYKKLLGKKVGLADYIELFPDTGRGLRKLLEFKGDVSEMEVYFDTTYYDLFGKPIVHQLIPRGSKIQVNNDNRQLYVSTWVDFYMNKVVETQFTSFYRGFQKVMGGNALSLFAPKEIEMIICGNDKIKIDTESFKSITKYHGWSSVESALESKIIQWFWEWFDQLDYKMQKKFLHFITGSDRIPATGIHTMSMKITRMPCYELPDEAKLPVAHTCFNELCVYHYRTRDEMWHKLNWAITESHGFGMR